jgi:hypothetical protein
MNKDPLHNLKDELDKELFQHMEITSQKRSIMSKIQQQKKKRRINWHMFLNFGIAAAIIFIVSILGSSYLPKDELADEDRIEENQEPQDDKERSTFIPEDELKEKLEEEKRAIQDRDRQSPVRVEEPDTDPKPPVEKEEPEKEEPVEEVSIAPTPFDFSYIIQNPGEFKDQASKGILHGTNTKLGETYDSIKEKYGDLPLAGGYEGGYQYFLGEDYVLSFTEEQGGILHRSEVRSQDTPLTVNQVIKALGDPYYFHNLMSDRIYLVYFLGGNQILMRVEGLVDLEPESVNVDYKVVGVDLEAKVTSVELSEKWLNEKNLPKEVRFISKEDVIDPLKFNQKWFTQAKEKALTNNQVKNVEFVNFNNSETQFLFKLTVTDETTAEKAKELIKNFIQELTRISEKDTGDQRVWDYFGYSLLVNSSTKGTLLEGYGTNYTKDPNSDKPHHTTGAYPPEIDWHEH